MHDLFGVDVAEVDEHRFSRTSLGVEGWACAKLLDDSNITGVVGVIPRVALSGSEILEMIPGVILLDVPPI